VIWALRRLAARGGPPLAHDFAAVAADLARRHRDDHARHAEVGVYMAGSENAFLIGELGLDLLAWTIAPSHALEARLAVRIAATVGDVRGLVWGGPGVMLAAAVLHEASGEARWAGLVRDHAEALWAAWGEVPGARCHLWNQALYGQSGALLGCLHGFAANVVALLRCRAVLDSDRVAAIEARALRALTATAVRADGLANWPMCAGPTDRPNPGRLMVQHCMGAPGMIHAVAALPASGDADALLVAAGALVWQAGPVAKLPGLCHGAPGNGYALLKLYRRTGDAAWLERARAFAMHAAAQAERALAVHGQRKWSLWTGDLGLALFLQDCIDGGLGFPTLDYF